MKEFTFLFVDWLQGKPIYPAIRRMLNFMFNASITSYFYEKIYGTYQWLSITDYKGVLNFLFKGYFFIPLAIYLLVLGSTSLVSVALFHLTTYFTGVSWTKKIVNAKYTHDDIRERLRMLKITSLIVSPVKFTESRVINLYHQLQPQVSQNDLAEITREFAKYQSTIENTFNLTLRALIAITIYFIQLPQFGWLLYVLVLAMLIAALLIFRVGYLVLEVLPIAVEKYYKEFAAYVAAKADVAQARPETPSAND
jgi:hypothetical protein